MTITSADEEGLPVDTPFPELEAVHPAPSDTKKGLNYPVLIHIDTLQDLVSRQGRCFQWRYGVANDVARTRVIALPLQACRTLPEPDHRSDEEDEHERR